MNDHPIYKIAFAKVYPLYLQKIEKKGRTKEEMDERICWLTGYDAGGLEEQIEKGVSLAAFFENAPQMNPDADKIKGSICGVSIEEIENPLMQAIRRMDKLIDDLAKGRAFP